MSKISQSINKKILDLTTRMINSDKGYYMFGGRATRNYADYMVKKAFAENSLFAQKRDDVENIYHIYVLISDHRKIAWCYFDEEKRDADWQKFFKTDAKEWGDMKYINVFELPKNGNQRSSITKG